MPSEDLFHEVYDKLNQYDQDQIRMDMLVLGSAFIKMDREGNVQRINPDEIYKQQPTIESDV